MQDDTRPSATKYYHSTGRCYHWRTNGYCAVPENIHTHPRDGNWKFQGGGDSKGNILKGKYEGC